MPHYHALIIGGGPAGSTAALTLRGAGRSVLVLEKEVFPRFHIGESLLPYNKRLIRELDLLPLMEQAGFPRKVGAQFWLGNGSRRVDFFFADGRYNEETEAWQVERAKFDELLLNEAARRGAEVRQGWAVESWEVQPERVVVKAVSREGVTEEFTADFLFDASGQHNFTGNREGLRELNPNHRKVAIFGHFHGVPPATPQPGREADILITRLEEAWSWLIPLDAEKTSVGLVVDQKLLKESGLSPEELFAKLVASSSVLTEKMAQAERIGPTRAIADYSYKNRRFVSPRLVRIGDAAGFMDPVFSSGVHLAMESGRAAAREVDEALRQGLALTPGLHRYEKWLRRGMETYMRLIEGFYTRPFIEVFAEPRDTLHLPCAISALVAGRLELPWRVRWRLEVFYFLVKLRKHVPFTESVRFS